MDFLFVLLLANPLNSLMDHPPRDLASLVEPTAVLQKMNLPSDEAALMGLLNAGADDALYVKKLMAIRLLERSKALYALPSLEDVANGPDGTLSEAAREAIAAIRGDPSPRPSGAALLKELARSLPADFGFVAVLDFERDARTTSFRSFMENAMKEITEKGLISGPVPRQAVALGESEFEEMILDTLSQIGNVRLDAAVLVVSSDIGVKPDAGYIGLICKGLYDRERVGRLLESAGLKHREVAGRQVYGEDYGSPQICLLDAHTFLAALTADQSLMEKLLGALTAAEKKPPQKTLAAAFDLVTEKKMRLAASGCLSPAQKERLHAEMLAATAEAGDDDRDTVLIADAAHKMFLALVQAEAYTAAFDTHGKLLFQATCSDKAAAATLGDTANNLRQLILDLVSKHAPEMPPLMRALFAQANKDAGLWTNAVADVTVTVQIDSQLQLAMMAAIKLYIKLYAEDTDAAIMCEGVSGAGTIRTAMRIYFSQNGTYAGATMKNIQIGDADLEGKYFAQSDYSLTGVTATTYLIKAGPPSKVKMRKKPYYTIDQTGREHGTYYTSQ